MSVHIESIPVTDGAVPTARIGELPSDDRPALVVIPSIFGPAPDLLRQLERFSDLATPYAPDPFWRDGLGAVPYGQIEQARGRLQGLDLARCYADLRAVIEHAARASSGAVVGLGICFGGPIVLTAAAEGLLSGLVTWHGSRMEGFLERADAIRCPLRFHYGSEDGITPPASIEKVRTAFAKHPDVEIVVHPGCRHGYSHSGSAYDEKAAEAGIAAVREVLAGLR